MAVIVFLSNMWRFEKYVTSWEYTGCLPSGMKLVAVRCTTPPNGRQLAHNRQRIHPRTQDFYQINCNSLQFINRQNLVQSFYYSPYFLFSLSFCHWHHISSFVRVQLTGHSWLLPDWSASSAALLVYQLLCAARSDFIIATPTSQPAIMFARSIALVSRRPFRFNPGGAKPPVES